MKLKNSKESLKLKLLFPVMYGSTLLLVILRTLQLTRFIDSETGFFTGGAFVNTLLYILIAGLCIYFTAVSFLSEDGKRVELAAVKDKGASVAAIIFGISLIYDSLSSFFDSIVIFDDISVGSFENGAETFKTLMATGTLPYALQSLFAVLSAVYVFLLAKSFSKGSLSAHNHKYLALSPIAWVAFKIITRFVKQISYIKVSDLFLELIMLAFMILFFVTLSQVLSGVYSDDTRWRIPALGFSSAVIALSLNIPRLILTLFGGNFVNAEYPFSPADALFGLFAFAVSLIAIKSATSDKQPIDNTGVIN